MTTAKQLRIWVNTMKEWLTKIDNAEVREHLARAAAEMERLADYKQAAERQLI